MNYKYFKCVSGNAQFQHSKTNTHQSTKGSIRSRKDFDSTHTPDEKGKNSNDYLWTILIGCFHPTSHH